MSSRMPGVEVQAAHASAVNEREVVIDARIAVVALRGGELQPTHSRLVYLFEACLGVGTGDERRCSSSGCCVQPGCHVRVGVDEHNLGGRFANQRSDSRDCSDSLGRTNLHMKWIFIIHYLILKESYKIHKGPFIGHDTIMNITILNSRS